MSIILEIGKDKIHGDRIRIVVRYSSRMRKGIEVLAFDGNHLIANVEVQSNSEQERIEDFLAAPEPVNIPRNTLSNAPPSMWRNFLYFTPHSQGWYEAILADTEITEGSTREIDRLYWNAGVWFYDQDKLHAVSGGVTAWRDINLNKNADNEQVPQI